jgi:hypothetical protein
MTSQPFNNNSSQRERAAILKNDAATLHQFAQSEAGEISGRWAKPQTVNASRPAVEYPRIKSGPWADDQPMPPEEPPLGFSVEDHDPVGQPWEIEASLDRDFGWRKTIRDGASASDASSPSDDVAAPGAVVVPSPYSPGDSSLGANRPDGEPLTAPGAGNKTVAIVPAPTNPRPLRRLR